MTAKRLCLLSLVFLIFLLTACDPGEIRVQSPTSTSASAPTPTTIESASPGPIPFTPSYTPSPDTASTAHARTPSPVPVSPAPIHTPAEPQEPAGPPAGDCINAGYPETACTGVAANTQWEPLVQDFNGIAMVLVPVGCFQMGNNEGRAEEQPAHEVCFDQPFWIDLTEVTPAQFAHFLNDQPAPVDNLEGWLVFEGRIDHDYNYQFVRDGTRWVPLPREENRPLEYVSWVGASDYCNWRDARLPTEAEWEYAARGPESYLYPWGNELNMNNFAISRGTLPEVGSFPQGASWVGALDMAGGVFEWTSSLYKPYPYRSDDGREASFEEDSTGKRVFRGSPWYHSDQEWDNISATPRYELVPDFAYWYHGFRCARSFEYQE